MMLCSIAVATVTCFSLPTHLARTAVDKYFFCDPLDETVRPKLFTNAISAGRFAFPRFDEILGEDHHGSREFVILSFSLLSAMPEYAVRYAPAARRIALDIDDEVKMAALGFLAQHGDARDLKLALTFMLSDENGVSSAASNILARFGGREEVILLEAIISYRLNQWGFEHRSYIKYRLDMLKKRLAAKQGLTGANP